VSYTLSQVCGFRGQWIMYIVRRSKYFRAQCLIQVTGVPPRCGEGNKNVWIRFRWYSLLRAPSPHWQPIQINLYSRMWRGWGGAVHWWISPNQYLYTCKLKCTVCPHWPLRFVNVRKTFAIDCFGKTPGSDLGMNI